MRALLAVGLMAALSVPVGSAVATALPAGGTTPSSRPAVQTAGPYEYLCYTSLKRLKTLRPSSTRTYSYDALTLQNALVYLDFPPPVPIKMDGWYGPATASAVKAYQKSRRLYVDGVVGPQTWRKLRGEIC